MRSRALLCLLVLGGAVASSCATPRDNVTAAGPILVPGSVRDVDGEPLPGVLVYVDAVGNLTTDSAGEFSFSVEEGTEVSIRIDNGAGSLYMEPIVVGTGSTAYFIEGFRVSHEPTIIGTEGADVIKGTAGPDVILALGGDDSIVGLGGNDVVIAGAGDDQVQGRAGDDQLSGGTGDDSLQGDGGNDTLIGWDGDDFLSGGGNADHLSGDSGNDTLHGGAGQDSLEDNIGNEREPEEYNLLMGGPGADTLGISGSNGQLAGGAGNDQISVSYLVGYAVRVNCGDGADVANRNNTGAYIPDDSFMNCESIQTVV
jgi:Ca2+-binding RTX toxin-like protein